MMCFYLENYKYNVKKGSCEVHNLVDNQTIARFHYFCGVILNFPDFFNQTINQDIYLLICKFMAIVTFHLQKIRKFKVLVILVCYNIQYLQYINQCVVFHEFCFLLVTFFFFQQTMNTFFGPLVRQVQVYQFPIFIRPSLVYGFFGLGPSSSS